MCDIPLYTARLGWSPEAEAWGDCEIVAHRYGRSQEEDRRLQRGVEGEYESGEGTLALTL